jgi:pyruvate dehydrogenase E1 component alpha subunit
MNVLSVRETFKWAKEYSIKNGPLFIELTTYRYHGHSMSDPGLTYRSRDEVADVRKSQDPVEQVRHMILDNKFGDEKELKDIEKKIKKDVDEAVEQAKADPFPEPDDLYTHIYAGEKCN